MATKTITVTKDAYEALKSLKAPRESFSKTILRVAKPKHSIWEFAGILSEKAGEELEQNIRELRKRRNIAHQRRLKRITKALEGM